MARGRPRKDNSLPIRYEDNFNKNSNKEFDLKELENLMGHLEKEELRRPPADIELNYTNWPTKTLKSKPTTKRNIDKDTKNKFNNKKIFNSFFWFVILSIFLLLVFIWAYASRDTSIQDAINERKLSWEVIKISIKNIKDNCNNINKLNKFLKEKEVIDRYYDCLWQDFNSKINN